MNKIVLRSKNEEELREKIKKNISLSKGETIEIKELKKPFKFLFFSTEGEYEVKIIQKIEKKDETIKKENSKKNNKINNNQVKKEKLKVKEEKKEVKISEQLPSQDKKLNKLNVIIKEFLALSNLNVVIQDISVKANIYKVELNGEDVRYLIGEKGIVLSSLEYLIMSIEEFKDIKVFIDSNNYKEKREKILRELAQKTAKTVLSTKRKVKLNPMPSRERKIIHEEISKIPDLETISVGVEPKRSLMIKYKNKK